MLKSDDMQGADSSAETEREESGVLNALLTAGPRLLDSYSTLLVTNRRIFELESQIALKSTAAIAVCLILLLIVGIALWIGVNAALALAIWECIPSLVLVSIAVAVCNGLIALALLKAVSTYAKRINFKQSLAMLDSVKSDSNGEI